MKEFAQIKEKFANEFNQNYLMIVSRQEISKINHRNPNSIKNGSKRLFHGLTHDAFAWYAACYDLFYKKHFVEHVLLMDYGKEKDLGINKKRRDYIKRHLKKKGFLYEKDIMIYYFDKGAIKPWAITDLDKKRLKNLLKYLSKIQTKGVDEELAVVGGIKAIENIYFNK